MVKEAEENADADKQRRELVEKRRNQAESLIHATEKSLEEHGDKVDPSHRPRRSGACDQGEPQGAARNRLRSARSRAASRTSPRRPMRLGEAIYKASQDEADDDADPDARGAPGG